MPDKSTVKSLLEKLDLGNSVAESDAALDRYFVETQAFKDLVGDKGDVIAGDKGTGKTAMFRILLSRFATLEALKKVEVVAAFNPVGSPVFQRLAQVEVMEEGEYVGLWKTYIFSLVGNWILDLYTDVYTDRMRELEQLLNRTGLNTADDAPETVFSQIMNRLRDLVPSAAEVGVSATPQGILVITPRVEFRKGEEAKPHPQEHVPYEAALGLVNEILREEDLVIWLVMDRLDEAFQGFPKVEIPALRALLRTYLDLQAYPKIRLKLFLRNDLFRKIAEGGFVNLTHINDRKIDIKWEDDDLFVLLSRRIRENKEFVAHLSLADDDMDRLFYAVFPRQVDAGDRRPTTWDWVLTRIQDGNNVKPPRNLIDLVRRAREVQLSRENRTERTYTDGLPVIEADSLKRGLAKLSGLRVNDTLIAEAKGYGDLIERFRGGKAEHTEESLQALLGVPPEKAKEQIQLLKEIGFLEASAGGTYKVPFLYRDGLEITQGKGF